MNILYCVLEVLQVILFKTFSKKGSVIHLWQDPKYTSYTCEELKVLKKVADLNTSRKFHENTAGPIIIRVSAL